MCVYPVACGVLHCVGLVFIVFEILCFALKCAILDRLQKIFTGCVEWAYEHPHVKYLSHQMVLKILT